MTSCSGLPICLSGIQIFPHHIQCPKSQHPKSQQMRPHMQVQIVLPVDVPTRSLDGESSSSDCENGGPAVAVAMFVPSSDMLRENSSTPERSSYYEPRSNMPNLPRLALAQQMADLDYRREAVRSRSLRVGASSLVDYQLSSRQSSMLSILLERQAKLEEGSDSISEESVCAKAA